MLDIFSFNYFMWILAAVIVFLAMYFGLKNRSYKFRYYFLFSLTILAWVIHFSRYYLEPNLLTYKLFFLDLCGFSTLMYPFFFMTKNPLYRDYMYFVGGVFAAHSLFYPNNIEGDPIFVFNTIRFFFAHMILISVPLLLVLWKMHIPNYKNIPKMILFVLVGGLYNFSLSAFFVEVGLRNHYINFMGLWGNDVSVFNIFEKVAPFFRYTVVVNNIEVSKPIPFFYMIPGLILFYTPVWIAMAFPFIKKIKKAN